MNTSSTASSYISYAISNKYRVMHINAQFITRLQQHTRAGLAAGTIPISIMRAVVNLLNFTANVTDALYHPTMNFFNSFYGYSATRYTCLIRTHNDAMTSLS